MKKFIMALAATIAMFTVPAMAQKAADGKSGFASSEACISAVRLGSAEAYVPVMNRAPGSAYAQMSMADAGYINGACVQGLTTFTSNTWVYLPGSFQVGKRDETIVMWQCGNSITRITKVPMNQIITRPAATTNFSSSAPLACKGEEECKQVNWCEANNGWYMSKDGAGNSIRRCDLPVEMSLITKENVLRIQEKTTILPEQLPTEVRPWKVAAPVTVPAALAIRVDVQGSQGPQVNMGRSQAGTVSGQSCETGNCRAAPVAKVFSQVNADFCGIRTTDGITLALLDMNGKLQVVKNPVFDRSNGKVKVVNADGDVVFNQIGTAQFNKNCDAVQAAVETKGWAQVVKDLKLPHTCQPAERITPPGNRFGNV